MRWGISMQCEKVLELLDAFRTGELEAEIRGEVARHLAGCASCARVIAEIGTISNEARALRGPAPLDILKIVLGEASDQYGAVDTDLGRFWVAYSPRGIRMLLFNVGGAEEFEQAYARRLGRKLRKSEVPSRFAELVRAAARGKGSGPMPVDLGGLAVFERVVLEKLQEIPAGEVRTYTWLARESGRPAAVRAVGNAMARNPVPVLLPCHRVVPVQGGVGNYAFGSEFKRALLEREGVPVDELEELRIDGVRFVGSDTTRIYCFPTCRAARRINPVHRIPFRGAEEAAAAGYRPCLVCRP
jgi:O-6-methylguanine DNA methyltransferase